MTNYTDKLLPAPLFAAVARAAGQVGVPTYVIGGWVRDLILRRESKDIDIVCVGDGIALAQAFAQELKAADPARYKRLEVVTFKNFGTAMVRADGWEVEFVGARRESYRAESRKPDVEPGTLADDQRRRDFTINAMAISLNEADFGDLLDPFGGMEDMRAMMLRTPLAPAETFSDDPLRMMRAVRFAAQLGFDIDPDAFEAMTEQAPRLEIVSRERIMTEFNKIVMTAKPSYGLRLAYYAKLLDQFFPELPALAGAENVEGKTHKDNFFHTLEVLDNLVAFSTAGGREADLWLRWAALLHDIAKPATKRFDKRVGWSFHGHEVLGSKMTAEIFKRLRLPMDEKMRRVRALVRLHLRPIALVNEQVTDSAVRRLMADAGEYLTELMLLCRADVTTKNAQKARRYLTNFDEVEKKMAQVLEDDRLRGFQPVLTGDHIRDALSLDPARHLDGILIGQIKVRIREDLLDGLMENTLSACWARLRQVLPEAWQGLRTFAQERNIPDPGPLPPELAARAEGELELGIEN